MKQVTYGRSIGSASVDLGALAECPVWGRVGDDDLDTYRAVLTDRPFDLQAVDPVVIRSAFTTAGGLCLSGSLSIDPAFNSVSLITIWFGGEQFGFNWQCQEWAKNNLHKLTARLGVDEASIFPVHFTTPVFGPDGGAGYSGVFTPFVNVEDHWNRITEDRL